MPAAKVKETFLKWPGNKTGLLPHILPKLPGGRRLVEPFVGSAAVTLASHGYKQYVLTDLNCHLINLYDVILDRGEEFIREARSYFRPHYNTEDAYYSFRRSFNEARLSELERACLFLYFNKHGWHGLCRFNAKGEFNVPYGHYDSAYFPEDELRKLIERRDQIFVNCQDFEYTLATCGAGDVVYCDPPYVPLTKTASFTAYTAGGFGHADQVRLVQFAQQAAERGAYVVISNHNTPLTQELYASATIHELRVRRQMAQKSEHRVDAPELLAVYAPQKHVVYSV